MSFTSLLSKGYFINYSVANNDSDQATHTFCGQHHIIEAWCPNCHKPLLQLLELDLGDARLRSISHQSFTRLPLLFCWTCNLAQEIFSYKIIKDEHIHILQYGKGGVVHDFPYENYPDAFPGIDVVLERIPEHIQSLFSQMNAGEIAVQKNLSSLCHPRHQLGGEPLLEQADFPHVCCPECQRAMPFLGCIADNCLDPRGFTGNEYVQVVFFYCQMCSIISAFQQCD